MKRYLTIAGRILGIVALVLVARTLITELDKIPPITLSVVSIAVLALALAYWAANVVFASYLWRLFLASQGVTISERTAFWVVGVSQIAKYLPSNLLHFAGQVALSKRAKIPTGPSVSSLAVQTGLTVIVPLILAGVGLLFDQQAWQSLGFIREHSTLGIIVIGALFTATVIAMALAPRLRHRAIKHLRLYKPHTVAYAALLLVLSFAGHGAVLHLLSNSIWQLGSSPSWFTFTWGFALSWVAGFVVPGLPGGLGVREAVFAALFGPTLGTGLAVGLAVLLRVISSAGDVLAFGLATLAAPRGARGRTASS